jgi:hypothetical protein
MSTSITSDRDIELLCEIKGLGVSNCCGAGVIDYQNGYFLCTDCKEYCDIINNEDNE